MPQAKKDPNVTQVVALASGINQARPCNLSTAKVPKLFIETNVVYI